MERDKFMKNQIIFIEWFYYTKLCHKFDMSRLIRKVYTYLKVFLRPSLHLPSSPACTLHSGMHLIDQPAGESASACPLRSGFHSQLLVIMCCPV